MKEQTSIEWLVGELGLKSKALKIMLNAHKEIIEQAKEIELERLVNAYANGQADSLSLIKNMKDIPSDFNQIISDNFNDLV